jgi:hypothetical protein
MSVLDDFMRMRLYRNRAAEAELLAETEPLPEARFRYRIVARHYRELADREERSDKARMAEHLELLKLKRREAAGSGRVVAIFAAILRASSLLSSLAADRRPGSSSK